MDFIFDSSLVLYLPFYELDGASFAAKDKHGHSCTVTGALWRPYGHYFDGTDDRIDCGASTAFDLTKYTIEAWFKINGTQGNKKIISKRSLDGTEMNFQFGPANATTWDLYWKSGGVTKSVAYNLSADDGNWHMIGITFEVL